MRCDYKNATVDRYMTFSKNVTVGTLVRWTSPASATRHKGATTHNFHVEQQPTPPSILLLPFLLPNVPFEQNNRLIGKAHPSEGKRKWDCGKDGISHTRNLVRKTQPVHCFVPFPLIVSCVDEQQLR